MNQGIAKFATWFLMEVAGCWAIWSTYMAIKFIIEVSEGQRASFSVHQANRQVGAFIIFPALATILWTIVSALFASAFDPD